MKHAPSKMYHKYNNEVWHHDKAEKHKFAAECRTMQRIHFKADPTEDLAVRVCTSKDTCQNACQQGL